MQFVEAAHHRQIVRSGHGLGAVDPERATPNLVFREAVDSEMRSKSLKSVVPPPRLERGTSRSTI